MTYKEALADLCCCCTIKPCYEMRINKNHCYSYNKLNELIVKAEKYRRHDLKKNPNDLPSDSGDVLVHIDCEKGKWYQVCHFENKDFYDALSGQYATPYVDAWKEIEQFEEDV